MNDYVTKEVFQIEIGHIKEGIVDIKNLLENRREGERELHREVKAIPVLKVQVKWIWGMIITVLSIVVKVAFFK